VSTPEKSTFRRSNVRPQRKLDLPLSFSSTWS
jgi:hypothetical protein